MRILKIYILWMKAIHYPNEIRFHLVTIVPMAPYTPKYYIEIITNNN